jgi:hypothetical protein
MIRIGLSAKEKQEELNAYLAEHGEIAKVFVFYYKEFKPVYKLSCEVEYTEYSEIIMYRTFYPLLEKINETSLIVIDECMRTQNRVDLTYNCAHHYLGQTPHRMIFEFFPIIENKEDMMILFDMEDKARFYRKPFDYNLLQTENIKIKPFKISFETVPVETPPAAEGLYRERKAELFDDLGQKDPNTVPRQLQLLAGDFKKAAVEPGKEYVARNKRLKLPNVFVYPIERQGKFYVIDMHYRRLNFNDFIKQTQQKRISYLSTMLPVDNVFANEFMEWKARLEAVYAKASIYK